MRSTTGSSCPSNPTTAGNIGFVVLLCLCVALVQVKGRWRTILLVPTLYLAACVWEARARRRSRRSRDSSCVGAILIVMMNARPQGLLGSRRVEVV